MDTKEIKENKEIQKENSSEGCLCCACEMMEEKGRNDGLHLNLYTRAQILHVR
jgi:hypothetical protein